MAASVTSIAAFGVQGFLHTFQNESLPEIPYRIVSVPWLSALSVWLLTGLALGLSVRDRVRETWGLEIACTLGVAYAHLIALHGRHFYGDVWDYFLAATRLIEGGALPPRYLYPPLWGTLLAPVSRAGPELFASVCWLANIASLITFQILLTRLLQRYSFPRGLSNALATILLLANVPLERTLGYVQVNLHVASLVYGAVLIYPAHPVWSALCLAAAAHLKASPVLIVVLFLSCRDWRWLTCFVVFSAGLTLPTLLAFGVAPFGQFLHNVINIYEANGIKFNDTSLDSLLRATWALAGSSPKQAIPVIIAAKLAVLTLLIVAGRRAIRDRVFAVADPAALTLNGLPVALVATVLLSPLAWEHHSVLLAIAYLLPLRSIRTPGEIAVWVAAVFIQFVVPVVAFYPWSYGRLLAHGIILILCLRLPSQAQPGPLFPRIARQSDTSSRPHGG